MATPETNAYETTARDEGRATSNGGSVPRCKLERAVERPAAGYSGRVGRVLTRLVMNESPGGTGLERNGHR